MADKDNIDKALPNVDQEVVLPKEELVVTEEDKLSEVTPDGAEVIMDEEGNLYGRGTLAHGWAMVGDTIHVRTLWEGDLDPGEYDLICEMKFEPDMAEVYETQFTIP